MNPASLRVAYLTAGAAGMYCGSCMHDNTLAAALTRLGVDVQLLPVYTPICTDEQDVSVDRVFFGGVNVYLQQRFPFLRFLPPLLDRWLDHPRLLRWATAREQAVDPKFLGALTVSMLRGELGAQRKEVRRLARYLQTTVRPELLVLTNILIGGCIPEVQRRLGVPVLVTLQGDDVFLDYLPEPHRSQALAEIRRLVRHVDGFLVHSRYYAECMSGCCGVPRDKFHILPLGIDTRDFAEFRATDNARAERPPTVGYLARLAPEKGLQVLVEAFLELRRKPGTEQAQLRIAGWLGENHRPFADEQFARLREAAGAAAFHYAGQVDRRGKIEFLRQLDVLSVPTTYRDPKGLSVLEALAAGVPVVQPAHGAFPELIESTGGGLLTPPGDAAALAEALHTLLTDRDLRRRHAQAGMTAVHEQRNAEAMARATLEVLRSYTTNSSNSSVRPVAGRSTPRPGEQSRGGVS